MVGVDEAPILSANLWGDNYGSANTGRAQGNALVSASDFSGFGDLAHVATTTSQG